MLVNKLPLYIIGSFLLFGLVIASTITLATDIKDLIKVTKDTSDCALSVNQIKCLKTKEDFKNKYNELLNKSLTDDKYKVKKKWYDDKKNVPEGFNPISLTEIEVEGKTYTVISAK